MNSFKDAAGRTWGVEITVATIRRVRALLSVDLLGVFGGDDPIIARLYSDPVLLCDLLYVICEPRLKETGVTDEQFGEAMRGDCIGEATRALVGALVDFCQSPKERENLRAVVAMFERKMDAQLGMASEMIKSGQLEKEMDQALEKSKRSSGSVPGSSESTPIPSPCASST